MSTAFERFIAGQDKLSDLLRALPLYAPPASLEASFAAAARAAQSSLAAPDASAARNDFHFQPPAQQAQDFAAMAARIDKAQSTRREALLQDITQGTPVAQALGTPVQQGTADWLQRRAQEAALRAAATTSDAAKTRQPWLRWAGWGISTVAAGLLAAVITQQLVPAPDKPAQMALQESMRAETTQKAAPRLPAAPRAQAKPAPAASQNQPERAPLRSRSAPAELADAMPPAAQAIGEIAQPAAVAPASRASEAEKKLAPSPSVEAAAAAAASAAPPALAQLDAQTVPQSERAAPSVAKPASPLPAAVRAMPAPQAKAANAEAGSALRKEELPPTQSMLASLDETPHSVATRMPPRPAGLVWTIFFAQPEAPASQAWLALLSREGVFATAAELRALPDASLPDNAARIQIPALPVLKP